MSPLIATLIWKVGVPLLLQILQRTGLASYAERLAIKWAEKLTADVVNCHTTASYPVPKNEAPSTSDQVWKNSK